MDLILSQLRLTKVNASLNNKEQKKQWQKELNDWFQGKETILINNKYIVEDRVKQISCKDFNNMFGTNIKYF